MSYSLFHMSSRCQFFCVSLFVAVSWFMTPVDGMASATANASSFLDAATSTVDFTLTKFDRPQTSCESLVKLSGSENNVLSATLHTAESGMPGLCVVRGVIWPEVEYIAYFPESWNARFYMVGNGGWAGESLDDESGHQARLKASRLGFVSAFTNTGHDASSQPGGEWGFGNLQKEKDFGFRAVHVTAVAVKALTTRYYGQSPSFSYFDGCSTGGLQGFSEAQRFPDDFDGILAGAPVFSLKEMMWQYWKNHKALIATPLTREKLELLGKIILSRHDMDDGVRDGVIGNPLAVDFDAQRDLPRASESQRGFTDDEIRMLDTLYGATIVSDEKIYPATPVGGEFGDIDELNGTVSPSAWEGRVVPDSSGQMEQPDILASWFRYLAFEEDDPDLDWTTLNPEQDLARTDQSDVFNATNPNLQPFQQAGGKMIIYHGWADFGVNPLRTIEYFEEAGEVTETDLSEFLQLYVVPGMHHCSGGVNVDRFDLMTPLINWVEAGEEPSDLVGYREAEGKIMRTRPLCAYPKIAVYGGKGSIDSHENFECSDPE
jgi:feruloyl esterase